MLTLPRRSILVQGAAAGLVAAAGWPQVARAEAGPSSDSEANPAEREAMRDEAHAFMHRYEVPGLSVAIARAGKLVYQEAFGLAARERHGEKLVPTNEFRIASVSKTITAVAIFTLIEAFKLRLDDKVFGEGGVLGIDYGRPPYGRYVEEITIDHLLTHTAGGWPAGDSDPMFRNLRMDHAELIAWTLRTLPLTSQPGTEFAFSNFGYCLLGRVIEKITQQRYAAYVRAKILEPCGIDGMAIAGNSLAQRRTNEVRYYGQDGQDPYDMNVSRMDSTAGWLARPGDLVRFLVHVDRFGDVPNILKPETVAIMTVPTRANPDYAKGWSVNRVGNWWQSGGFPGTSAIAVRTHSDFCWAALANSYRPDSSINADLDALIWRMVGKVSGWTV